ncbi:MAG TPA: hypothetical protein VKA26_12185 [Ignavibacteriaceae bacterium]|nr:hypothetical protein [Ignavibacteriaceae bacterium]
MENLIIVFGVLFLAAGVSFFVKPDYIFEFLRKEANNINLQILAITVRLLLGFLLIYFANSSRYPNTIAAIGWFIILAAIVLLLMGRKSFQRLIAWALNFFKPYRMVGGLVAILFGMFLIYAFI